MRDPGRGEKDTNPKDAVGVRKVPLRSIVPAPVIGYLALALLEGARKYGSYNYRIAGVRASVYYDAHGRHMDAWWNGEDIDPDSGLCHVDKAIASLVVLRDSMLQGNWVDDRPPRAAADWVKQQNAEASRIIDTVRPNDPVPPYTQTGLKSTTENGTNGTPGTSQGE